jgi:hypothetical protein
MGVDLYESIELITYVIAVVNGSCGMVAPGLAAAAVALHVLARLLRSGTDGLAKMGGCAVHQQEFTNER